MLRRAREAHDPGEAGFVPASEEPLRRQPDAAVPTTRTSTAWVAVGLLLVALTLALLFILQNLRRAQVSYFTAHWTAPLAVDLLLAAVLGGLVVTMVGALRIVQLRSLVRRHRRARLEAESHLHEQTRQPNGRTS
jgi:uncharacterized integral membrane protein